MRTDVLSMTRRNGVAGQYSYDVRVRYSGDGYAQTLAVSFVGSIYGGPVFLVDSDGQTYRVKNPERFGDKLTKAWVRSFYAPQREVVPVG